MSFSALPSSSSESTKRRRMESKPTAKTRTPKSLPRNTLTPSSHKRSTSKGRNKLSNENESLPCNEASPRFKKRIPKIQILDTPCTSYSRRKTDGDNPPQANAPLENRRVSVSIPSDAEVMLSHRNLEMSETQSVLVVLRVRPPLNHDGMDVCGVVHSTDTHLTVLQEEKPAVNYQLDKVLDDSVVDPCNVMALQKSQLRLFSFIGESLLDSFINGYNCTLFAYGQTGSGKTFSMFGSNDIPGLIPQFSCELFGRLGREVESGSAKIELSFFEIYSELIFDLLTEGVRAPLNLRRHPKTGPFVDNLSWVPVTSAEHVQQWLAVGQQRRATAATGMNERSSRSHSLVQLKLTMSNTHSIEGKTNTVTTTSQANLVDLAGSERSNTAQATVGDKEESDKRYKETIGINSSLTALKRVMTELSGRSQPQGFVPYRDSTLTYLLSESLGGNSKTALLATISPLRAQVEESLSTLRFATQARAVITCATVNRDYTSVLVHKIIELEAQNAALSQNGSCKEQLESKVSHLKEKLNEAQIEIEQNKRHFQVQLVEAEARKARLMGETGGTFSVDQLREEDGPFLVRLQEDAPHLVLRVIAPHNFTNCRITFESNQWCLLSVSRDYEIYVNGNHVDSASTGLNHLDRIVLEGSEVYLWWLPDSTHRRTLCDPTTQLIQYDYHFARLEYMQGLFPRFQMKLELERKKQVSEYKEEVLEELGVMRRERDRYARDLEEARRSLASLRVANEEDSEIHKKKIRQLESQVSDRELLLNQSTDSLHVTQQFCSNLSTSALDTMEKVFQQACSPLAASPLDGVDLTAIKLAEQVQFANDLLKRLGKDIFKFELMPFEVGVQLNLVDIKHRLFVSLTDNDFTDRVEQLEAACAYAAGSDSNAKDELLQRVLYRGSDQWARCDGRQSNVFTAAWQNALTQTASKKNTTMDKLRRSMSASTCDRRSTLSALLNKGDSSDGNTLLVNQYIHSILSLEQELSNCPKMCARLTLIEGNIIDMTSLHKSPWGQSQLIAINRCVTALLRNTAWVRSVIDDRMRDRCQFPLLDNPMEFEYLESRMEEACYDCSRTAKRMQEIEKCWLNAVESQQMQKATEVLHELNHILPNLAKLWAKVNFYGKIECKYEEDSLKLRQASLIGLRACWQETLSYFQAQRGPTHISNEKELILDQFHDLYADVTGAVGGWVEDNPSSQFVSSVSTLAVNIINPLSLAMIQIASHGKMDKTPLHGLLLELRTRTEDIQGVVHCLPSPQSNLYATGSSSEVSITGTSMDKWLDSKLQGVQTFLEKL